MNIFRTWISTLAHNLDVARAERAEKEAERIRITDKLERERVEDSNNAMLSKYCPHVDGQCRKDCQHFQRAFNFHGGPDWDGTPISRLSPAKCKLEKR